VKGKGGQKRFGSHGAGGDRIQAATVSLRLAFPPFYALCSPLFFPLLLSFHTVQPSKNAVHDIFTVHLLLAGSALLQDQLPSAGSAAEEALAFVEVRSRLT
jgi:hypothetical protein